MFDLIVNAVPYKLKASRVPVKITVYANTMEEIYKKCDTLDISDVTIDLYDTDWLFEMHLYDTDWLFEMHFDHEEDMELFKKKGQSKRVRVIENV